ncbi:MAG TPA: hypothetical protein VGS96_22655 [Thermoanaerobaculia bacterium]|jgi:hypothetical protein|nr:hypothetical protein [Thermoanaerobaculia bacterium]
MNNQTRFRAIMLSVLAVAVAVGIAVTAYNFGVQHAALEGGKVLSAPPGTQYVYVRPWGFGFGFFPLLLILFWFLVVRQLFWRGGYRGGWHHCQHVHDAPQPPEQKV